jgi:hypothetical protein
MNSNMNRKRIRKSTKMSPASSPEGDVRPHLAPEHMHKLFHLGGMVDRFSAQIGMLEKDDASDELTLKLQQETLQRLQAEFALRRQRRSADRQQLLGHQAAALRNFTLYRDELSGIYGADLSQATFDDITGLIQFPAPADEPAPPPPTT